MTFADWTLQVYRQAAHKPAKWSWSQAAAFIVIANTLLWAALIALVWHLVG